MPSNSQTGRPSRTNADQAMAAWSARSTSSSRTSSSHRPNSELVPWSRARRPSAVSSTERQRQRRRDADGGRRAGRAERDDRGRRQHHGRRGRGHGVGPDRRRTEPLGQPLGQGEGPDLADRLVGQSPGQLRVGREQRLGPVEPPEHGGLGRVAAAEAAAEPRSVVEPVRSQHGGIRPGRTGDQREPGPGSLADELAQLAVLLRARVHGHRLTLGGQLDGQVGEVADHGAAQHDLGRDQAPRPARAGVDRQVHRPG